MAFQSCALNGNIQLVNKEEDLYTLAWFLPLNQGMIVSVIFMIVFHLLSIRQYVVRFSVPSASSASFASFASATRLIPLLWTSTILLSDLALFVNQGYANRFTFQPFTLHFLAEYTLALSLFLQARKAYDSDSKEKFSYVDLTLTFSSWEEFLFLNVGLIFMYSVWIFIALLMYLAASPYVWTGLLISGGFSDLLILISSLTCMLRRPSKFQLFACMAVFFHMFTVASVITACISPPVAFFLHYVTAPFIFLSVFVSMFF